MLCLCLTGISQHRLVTNQWACGVEAHQWGKVPVPWVGRAAHFAHAARAAPAAHAARAAPAACAARTACAAKVLATLGAQQGPPSASTTQVWVVLLAGDQELGSSFIHQRPLLNAKVIQAILK